MLQAERHKIICSYVDLNGSALVAELAVMCKVSQGTIRRDLSSLDRNRKLSRSFGGALSLCKNDERISLQRGCCGDDTIDRAKPLRKRAEEHPEIKMKLAKAALQFIQPGDSILLDNSSTCWFLARQIPDIDLTVVTNSIKIIQALACRDKVRIIACGGEYSERHEDFHGPVAESVIRNFQINAFFFSCQGFDEINGIRDGSEINARLKNVMLQVSDKKILLADSSKFGKPAFSKICMLTDIDTLIINGGDNIPRGNNDHLSLIQVDA